VDTRLVESDGLWEVGRGTPTCSSRDLTPHRYIGSAEVGSLPTKPQHLGSPPLSHRPTTACKTAIGLYNA
jgi:hypothetical protein